MAGKRKITQVKPQFGNNRSHSMKATRRQFKPNIQSKRIWVPEAGRFVRVQVTAQELKTIDKIGLDEFMKRQGRVWIRIFPDVPVSGKPAEVRMGKGKGAVDFWAARVAPGRIMFEIDGVPLSIAEEALRLGAAKLPIKTRFVARPGEHA